MGHGGFSWLRFAFRPKPATVGSYTGRWRLEAKVTELPKMFIGSIPRNLSLLRRFPAWLLQIVVNAARMHRRHLRMHLYGSIDEVEDDNKSDSVPRQFADWHDLPNEALEREQLIAAVRSAVDKLPEIYREVLLLIDSQHLSYLVVAEGLGVSVGVVKTRVHRARMRIQEQLGPVFQPRFSDHIRLMKGMNPWSRAKS